MAYKEVRAGPPDGPSRGLLPKGACSRLVMQYGTRKTKQKRKRKAKAKTKVTKYKLKFIWSLQDFLSRK